MKIAIQGYEGSFHHLAAQRWFDDEQIPIVACASFGDVFLALTEGRAQYAIIAIENSLHGSINEVYDLLLRHKFSIIGEIPERIHQQLIGFEGTPLDQITHVYSHPVAFSQCASFLDTYLPNAERIEHHDTAESVAYIKTLEGRANAAIAGRVAASIHDMVLLHENIQDEDTNFTRFLVIQPEASPVLDADKVSLVLRTSHEPGALYRALGVFERHGSNLTKLQSRPIRGKVWKYQFFVDAILSKQELDAVIDELTAQQCEVTLLGHYASAATLEVE